MRLIFSFATLIYHAFTCVAYLSPLVGSVLADSYLGRFKVILYGSSIYVLGHVLLSFGAVPTLGLDVRTFFDYGGLFVIALATGAIKPCVSAFAADQFTEEQQDLRAQFFSFFYFAINAGSLFAIILTPILRGRVSCLGSQYCFPLAFGVPGVLMVVALLFFLCGWKMYKKFPPSRENIAGAVIRCIWLAGTRTLFGRSSKPVAHWLDRAAPEFSSEMIQAVRSFVNVAVIFGPLVFFWALFDQQGSTWVLQARRLDGRIGWLTVLPEQINILNPLVVLIMVPVFEGFIYPCARKAAMGSVRVLHVHDNTMESDYHELVRPNTVSILWVLPQYFVITLGEVLLSVTGLEFAYSQSAPNMKSVLQALWLLTVFMGNVIDMGISGTHIIPEPATEFFFYAFLMILVMGIFILLACRYTYVENGEEVQPTQKKEHVISEDTTC
ncbi:unnamed protein product [Haemonchus placei]|uniref:Solute carrier family 15 member 2 n=1 Tax=Haemonchus placei TaxID=6290 RepID=A0A158QL26_HAEPC|nr:unnamed protein product [Haemonchus placei]